MNAVHNFLFTVYPYICLAVFFMGSLARFDRDQYTWKSDSSQMLRARQLKIGSNLFEEGIDAAGQGLHVAVVQLVGQTSQWLR